MKVVVGLGNPGDRYRRTRHNIGFDVIAELSRRGGDPRPRQKFDAEIFDIQIGSEKIALVCPQTFMNLSGAAIRPLLDFHQLPLSELLVVCDDMNLETGRLRLRTSGSAGGQKGLDDLIRRLGSNAFARLRVGIGRPPPKMDAADYVLGKFRPHETEIMEDAVAQAADAVECWAKEGAVAAMNRVNPASPPNTGTQKDDAVS